MPEKGLSDHSRKLRKLLQAGWEMKAREALLLIALFAAMAFGLIQWQLRDLRQDVNQVQADLARVQVERTAKVRFPVQYLNCGRARGQAWCTFSVDIDEMEKEGR